MVLPRAGIPFWHSRIRLTAGCAALGILILVVDIREITQSQENAEKERRGRESEGTVDDILGNYDNITRKALEAIEYIRDIQLGRPFVRPVVEEEDPFLEWYWGCNPSYPLRVESVGWVESTDDIQIYSAHYDRRDNSLYPDNHVIQILAMSTSSIENKTDVYCTIYGGKRSGVVKGYIREIWQRAWDPRDEFSVPNLISCPVPDRLREQPNTVVALSHTVCETPRVAVRVQTRKPVEKKAKVAVCVKGMDFQEEIAYRFLEWLEAQYILGVDTVSVYTYTVSQKTQKILKHYEASGALEWIPLTLPIGFPNEPTARSDYIWRNRQQKRRMELIPYNDCLYRHIETHDYILVIDTDEVFVPLQHIGLPQLLDEVEKLYENRKIGSLSVRNVFKFPSKTPNTVFPEYLYMLRNEERSEMTSRKGDYGKSFTSTRNIATVFNHFGLHRISRSISSSIYLPEELVIKLHYKSKCPIESKNECEELINNVTRDTSIDRWRDILKERVQTAIQRLGL